MYVTKTRETVAVHLTANEADYLAGMLRRLCASAERDADYPDFHGSARRDMDRVSRLIDGLENPEVA